MLTAILIISLANLGLQVLAAWQRWLGPVAEALTAMDGEVAA
jgi:hypothetical protein